MTDSVHTEPVLGYPTTAVIGATDLSAMALFLSAFGMLPRAIRTIPADAAEALYGSPSSVRELEMYTPGSDRTIRIVETDVPALPFKPLVAGPYGLDFYSRDLDVTIGMVKAAGGHNFTELVGYPLEPTKHPEGDPDALNYEILFQGPDELTIYVTDLDLTPNHYPGLLDRDPELVNSELIMLCWVTGTPDRERDFWENEVGVTVLFDGYPSNDKMVDLMYHPRPTPTRCLNISDGKGNTKIELMSYAEEQIETPPTWPIRGGMFSGVFVVDNVEAAVAKLPSATFGEIVTFEQLGATVTATSGVSPSGVRFEMRSVSE
jgi:hypothetical protein